MIDQERVADRRIVVGVDGSAGSKRALCWALGQARMSGASVEAVAAWQVPPMYAYAYGWAPTGIDDAGIVTFAEKALAETVAEVLGKEQHPIPVTTRVVEGPAAQVLLAAGNGAQMLVVGSRGHGAFAGMMLGSVSQHCVQHAACPTAVIPA
ncbi:universal stress protein [Actinoplanes awajinensis]|uniref:UspA domain-containing protein n=1 Tax=Actinoplanes awajinensis subsp. mycoplanecinus TaxID=135947 RepID=A0A0X3V9K3_9ACTN|nr:universal stress protein [Actinoplanes awajinensis]KUL41254.1 hypothetical protein ADL15_05135 [Actinoplanes awajinensis subsp. mycoplanecinus]